MKLNVKKLQIAEFTLLVINSINLFYAVTYIAFHDLIETLSEKNHHNCKHTNHQKC